MEWAAIVLPAGGETIRARQPPQPDRGSRLAAWSGLLGLVVVVVVVVVAAAAFGPAEMIRFACCCLNVFLQPREGPPRAPEIFLELKWQMFSIAREHFDGRRTAPRLELATTRMDLPDERSTQAPATTLNEPQERRPQVNNARRSNLMTTTNAEQPATGCSGEFNWCINMVHQLRLPLVEWQPAHWIAVMMAARRMVVCIQLVALERLQQQQQQQRHVCRRCCCSK